MSDAAMDRLFAGSLRDFVAERKALAAELKSAGDKEGARALAAVPKPSLSAWVLNQLSRKARDEVMAVLAALDRQRDLQLGALSGRLDADALGAAREAEAGALAAVLDRVPGILESDGHAASKGNVDRVARAIRAAALDPEERPRLLAGRLIRDVAEGGFEAVASQLDPALLLAALSAKGERPAPAPRKVDGLFARSARSDADRATTSSPREIAAGGPAPAPDSTGADRAERLVQAKIAAAQLRAQIEEQRQALERCEARAAALEKDLDAAHAEARSARRKLGDLKERLEQTDRRVRLLEE